MKLSIIIPVYNERRTIKEILRRVLLAEAEGLKKEIVIIDDSSSDGTIGILKSIEVDAEMALTDADAEQNLSLGKAIKESEFKIIYHEKNTGKSGALRTGFSAAAGDIILIQDSDLEYDPRDYPRLLRPIIEGRADVVYGSRFLGDSRRVLMFWHSLGNKFLTLVSNAFTNLNLTDMETCYKVFRSEVIKDLNLESERFGFEPEVTVKIAKMRYRVYEVPVSYNGRSYAEGKKITWKDGFHSLWLLFRHSVLTSEFLKSGVMEETLTKLTALHEFNQYIYESIAQHLGSSILEVGAGNGNITEFLLGAGDVVASDIDSSILKRLSLRFSGISNLKVMKWDISKPFPAKNLSEGFDSVVCLNVLEHIEDNVSVLKNMKNVLKDHSGNLILLVPAHQYLFSEIDRKLGHHRRYDRDEIVNLLDRTGLEITYFTPFNMFGFFGWLLNGKILRKERLSTAQLELYRYLSSVFIQIEKILKQPFGLSHLIVAQRKYPDS